MNRSQGDSEQKKLTSKKVIYCCYNVLIMTRLYLHCGSDGEESAFNVGDPGSNPGSGKSPGERNGYPFQYSFLENSMDRGAWQATVHGVTKSGTQLRNFHFHTVFMSILKTE